MLVARRQPDSEVAAPASLSSIVGSTETDGELIHSINRAMALDVMRELAVRTTRRGETILPAILGPKGCW